MSRSEVYFSLIHARASFPNEYVERFHRRLDEEVRTRATPPPGLRAESLHYATEREARLALAAPDRPEARVLVPLYTREFLHDPPADFASYLFRRSDVTDLPFVHPVMWDFYVPPRAVCGIAQALSLGNAVREYEACGMATICRHNAYAAELRQIVEVLADRIVRAAEHPGHVPDWMPIEPPAVTAPSAEARFLILLARPPGHGAAWTPYEPDGSDVIERAVHAARRLVLLPEVVDALAADLGAETADSAGILLLDPAALHDPATRPAVEKLLRRLPAWITVVVVAGRDHRNHEPVERATPAWSAPEFARVADEAIHRARRNYLRGHPS